MNAKLLLVAVTVVAQSALAAGLSERSSQISAGSSQVASKMLGASGAFALKAVNSASQVSEGAANGVSAIGKSAVKSTSVLAVTAFATSKQSATVIFTNASKAVEGSGQSAYGVSQGAAGSVVYVVTSNGAVLRAARGNFSNGVSVAVNAAGEIASAPVTSVKTLASASADQASASGKVIAASLDKTLLQPGKYLLNATGELFSEEGKQVGQLWALSGTAANLASDTSAATVTLASETSGAIYTFSKDTSVLVLTGSKKIITAVANSELVQLVSRGVKAVVSGVADTTMTLIVDASRTVKASVTQGPLAASEVIAYIPADLFKAAFSSEMFAEKQIQDLKR